MEEREKRILLKSLIPVPKEITFEDAPDFVIREKAPLLLRFGGKKQFLPAAEKMVLDSFKAFWNRTVKIKIETAKKGIPVKEAAKRLGITANTASKIKRRVEERILAIVRMYEK